MEFRQAQQAIMQIKSYSDLWRIKVMNVLFWNRKLIVKLLDVRAAPIPHGQLFFVVQKMRGATLLFLSCYRFGVASEFYFVKLAKIA